MSLKISILIFKYFFYRMLVGAPLDQNRQPGTRRSGALWQCPMSTYSRDCIQVITDGRLSTFYIYLFLIIIIVIIEDVHL